MKIPLTIFSLLFVLVFGGASAFVQGSVGSTNATTTLYLTRTRERVSCTNETGKVVTAKRGILYVGTLAFPTIERIGVVSMKKGMYECAMEQQHNPDGSEKRKVFRIQTVGPMGHKLKNGSGGPAAILIHAANYPSQLTGCIAPGRRKDADGVDEAVAAMMDIFDACGGFSNGKKMRLVVRN
ncbi:MAG: hypothetical protein JWM68_957 [Verrucomicrobiales bacterium]|nr:hypothetical protein [Verrucomicrobiales bacterium]